MPTLRIKPIHHYVINHNRIRVGLKSGKEKRTRFVDSHVMLFVNAHPQIEIAGGAEIKNEQPINGYNSIYKNLELAPELIETDINLVNFCNSYVENVMHLMC